MFKFPPSPPSLKRPGGEVLLKRTVGAVAQFVLCLHKSVDLMGAFVNDRATGVAQIPLNGEFIAESVSSVNLDSFVRGIEGSRAVGPLGHADFFGVAKPLILHPADLVVKQPTDLTALNH